MPMEAESNLTRIDYDIPEWARNVRMPQPAQLVEDAFRTLIVAAERDASDREGLAETPGRAARAWAELTSGYRDILELKTFDAEGSDGIVAQAGIPFYSLCEHHLLPFHGTVDIAYLPGDRIIGLSKFSRLVVHYSRRLQVQERLNRQIADELVNAIKPRGVMVIIRATHTCMEMRGVQKLGAKTTSSVVTGVFKENAQTRAEAMGLLR